MIAGEFAITDGTTYIDLIHGAFRLVEWTPAITQEKGGGVWNDNMLADGRRPVIFKRGNAVETLSLRVVTDSMDDTIREVQELRRLLEKAKDYWTTNYQNTPVYIIARGSCETNSRYAYVFNYVAERDDDPYQSPFFGEVLATMDEFSLSLERTDWLENPPGQGSCVAIASQQTYWSGSGVDTAAPTQLEDDIYVQFNPNTSDNTATFHYLGRGAVFGSHAGSGIRFRAVAVPAGATITSARVDIVASHTDTGNASASTVYGELDAAPAVFGNGAAGYTDFVGRPLTTNSYSLTIETTDTWAAGSTYTIAEGPAFVAALQEIIDLGGWAAGNNLSVLIYPRITTTHNNSHRYASFDHAAYAEPILYVSWITGETALAGRAATCTNEVYIANKHNLAQLTDAYYYDLSLVAYTDIMAAVLPADLFPAVPAAGDIFYAGITTGLLDSGPFSSIIFDIGTAAVDITAVSWEYWDGAAWADLDVVSTIDDAPAQYFSRTGVGSVSFDQPDDWAANDPGMGVTAFWVRCYIDAVGAAPTAPTQQNRLLYTVVRPSVDIDELQIAGDIPALAKGFVRNYSEIHNNSIQSVLLSSRSQDRGTNFRMYLNLSDEQNIDGIDAYLITNTAFADWLNAPSGRAIHYNPGAGSSGICFAQIDTSVANDFFGKYRCYLRLERHSAVTDCTVQLKARVRDFWYVSEVITITSDASGLLIDFGILDIPGFGVIKANEILQTIRLYIYLTNVTATPDVYLYDLILLPIDEWSGEFVVTDTAYPGLGIFSFPRYFYLDIDRRRASRLIALYSTSSPFTVT